MVLSVLLRYPALTLRSTPKLLCSSTKRKTLWALLMLWDRLFHKADSLGFIKAILPYLCFQFQRTQFVSELTITLQKTFLLKRIRQITFCVVFSPELQKHFWLSLLRKPLKLGWSMINCPKLLDLKTYSTESTRLQVSKDQLVCTREF